MTLIDARRPLQRSALSKGETSSQQASFRCETPRAQGSRAPQLASWRHSIFIGADVAGIGAGLPAAGADLAPAIGLVPSSAVC